MSGRRDSRSSTCARSGIAVECAELINAHFGRAQVSFIDIGGGLPARYVMNAGGRKLAVLHLGADYLMRVIYQPSTGIIVSWC